MHFHRLIGLYPEHISDMSTRSLCQNTTLIFKLEEQSVHSLYEAGMSDIPHQRAQETMTPLSSFYLYLFAIFKHPRL